MLATSNNIIARNDSFINCSNLIVLNCAQQKMFILTGLYTDFNSKMGEKIVYVFKML
jgi:hypothetical protein